MTEIEGNLITREYRFLPQRITVTLSLPGGTIDFEAPNNHEAVRRMVPLCLHFYALGSDSDE